MSMTTTAAGEVRLAIFRKPRRNRFKVYAVGRPATANGGVSKSEKRIATGDQPFHGFKTLPEAREALETLDIDAETRKFRRWTTGTPIPPEETEVCSRPPTTKESAQHDDEHSHGPDAPENH